MYISVLKNKKQEISFLEDYGKIMYNKNVVPFIEVIKLNKNVRKRTDNNCSISELIQYYDSIIDQKYFIDFFAMGENEYPKCDNSKVQFSIAIRDEFQYKYYDDLLYYASKSDKAIPVISIKSSRNFILSEEYIKNLVNKLQSDTNQIAIRLDSILFSTYYELIDKLLRDEDYFFYDINEESIESKIFDEMEIDSNSKNYKKILLYSPRSSKITNGKYANCEYTDLINNELLLTYNTSHHFDGIADYAGLKNDMPIGGGNGKGAALALFFDLNENKNKFYAVVQADTSLGVKGFQYVKKELLNSAEKLDPMGKCEAFKYMKKRSTSGNYATWIYITILRYMSEIQKIYN